MQDDSTESPRQGPGSGRWLLLIHQIPPKPDYFRVKVRRRLHRIGARALKNSVYILPNTDDHLEDFEWLAREILTDGGEAAVCAADFVAGTSTREIEAMFETGQEAAPTVPPATAVRGRTWVTRTGVKVDRIGSAWLIRRFVDPEATFKFVAPQGYRPLPGELRFDMYDGEYGHEGGSCTFETLINRFALADPALTALGEVVHDVDCKDEKFGRPEAPGLAVLISGLVQRHDTDAQRLERGAAVFEDLYAHFHGAA